MKLWFSDVKLEKFSTKFGFGSTKPQFRFVKRLFHFSITHFYSAKLDSFA